MVACWCYGGIFLLLRFGVELFGGFCVLFSFCEFVVGVVLLFCFLGLTLLRLFDFA